MPPAARPLSEASRWKLEKWGYDLNWPAGAAANGGKITVTAEAIKFAFNAWTLIRGCAFYGTAHPRVLRSVHDTRPSMDIAVGGNRIFHTHCRTAVRTTDPSKLRVALTPAGADVRDLDTFDWSTELNAFRAKKAQNHECAGVEIVVGQENGLSRDVSDDCDFRLSLPQYGSVGSLSMNCALGVAVSRASAALCAGERPEHFRSTPSLLSTGASLGAVRCALTSDPYSQSDGPAERPHTDDLIGRSDADIRRVLADRRSNLPMQLAVVWENINADRNIGATCRSANAYNCERLVVLGRRKFSRRGCLGTQNYTDLVLVPDLKSASPLLEGFQLWALWNDYPVVADYLGWGPMMPLDVTQTLAAESRLLSCENTEGMVAAMQAAKSSGCRGIALVVPEDGCSHTPEMWSRCERVVTLTSTQWATQRGMAPAVAATIALERLRFASLRC
jgi:tRNA G18 (ribose-2'-O)-methylase SpoU